MKNMIIVLLSVLALTVFSGCGDGYVSFVNDPMQDATVDVIAAQTSATQDTEYEIEILELEYENAMLKKQLENQKLENREEKTK